MRVTDITTARVKTYIDKRMNEGLSNASINRELAALKRMFHLAAECTPPKVSMIPHIPMLKESNVRKGFFEHDEYLLPEECPTPGTKDGHYLCLSFRMEKEQRSLGLIWDKVDLKQGIFTLDPGETKNEEGRTLYLNEELSKGTASPSP